MKMCVHFFLRQTRESGSGGSSRPRAYYTVLPKTTIVSLSRKKKEAI